MNDEKYAGEIRLFAGEFAPDGWLDCDGSERDVASFRPLYDAIGKHFGVSSTKFRLPNLRGQVPIHMAQGGAVGRTGNARVTLPPDLLKLRYIIATSGDSYDPDAFVGEVRTFGLNFAPEGWLPCTGERLPLASYTAVFSILGTRFGGNGSTYFQLPDLRSGEQHGKDGLPCVGMSYCIAVMGRYPPRP